MRFVLPLVPLILSACAFKSSPPSVQNDARLEVKIGWRGGKSPLAQRFASNQDNSWKVLEPVTLALPTPNTVQMQVRLPQGMLSASPVFGRAHFSTRGVQGSLVVSDVLLDPAPSGERFLRFGLQGLQASLIDGAEGEIQVRLYGESSMVLSLDLPVRTPPKHLAVKELSLKDWATTPEKLALAKASVFGERFALLRAYEVTNEDRWPVEVTLPLSPQGRVDQWTADVSYRDQGCQGGAVISPQTVSLASSFVWVELDGEAYRRMGDVALQPTRGGSQRLRLEAGQVRTLGLFSVGSWGHEWMERGPLGPDLHPQRCAVGCNDVCRGYECNGPLPGEIQVEGCRCSWRERVRNYESLMLGINRGPVVLRLDAESLPWTVSYADTVSPEQEVPRVIIPVSNETEVSWF